jgi:bacterial/archaeal transporter family-2 protein
MNSATAAIAMSILMFISGLGIPIMAAMNAGLGVRMGNPNLAAFILFLVAATTTGAALLIAGPRGPVNFNVPPYLFLGGLCVAFYVLCATWAAPTIGLGNAILLVLLGQMASAAAIDHFGLFGALQTMLTVKRTLGIILMTLGLYLARRTA